LFKWRTLIRQNSNETNISNELIEPGKVMWMKKMVRPSTRNPLVQYIENTKQPVRLVSRMQFGWLTKPYVDYLQLNHQ